MQDEVDDLPVIVDHIDEDKVPQPLNKSQSIDQLQTTSLKLFSQEENQAKKEFELSQRKDAQKSRQ